MDPHSVKKFISDWWLFYLIMGTVAALGATFRIFYEKARGIVNIWEAMWRVGTATLVGPTLAHFWMDSHPRDDLNVGIIVAALSGALSGEIAILIQKYLLSRINKKDDETRKVPLPPQTQVHIHFDNNDDMAEEKKKEGGENGDKGEIK